MRIRLGELRRIIRETHDGRDPESPGVPTVGSWIMFNQHGRHRRAEPVRIVDVGPDDVEISWGSNDYRKRVPREEIELREDPTVMDDDDPRVLKSLEPSPQPTRAQVYGGDPDRRPWGLGT